VHLIIAALMVRLLEFDQRDSKRKTGVELCGIGDCSQVVRGGFYPVSQGERLNTCGRSEELLPRCLEAQVLLGDLVDGLVQIALLRSEHTSGRHLRSGQFSESAECIRLATAKTIFSVVFLECFDDEFKARRESCWRLPRTTSGHVILLRHTCAEAVGGLDVEECDQIRRPPCVVAGFRPSVSVPALRRAASVADEHRMPVGASIEPR
jgi:hypothetical protein